MRIDRSDCEIFEYHRNRWHVTWRPSKFGLVEFGVLDAGERLRRYRRYVYEAGAVPRPDNAQAAVIDPKTLEAERDSDFKLSRIRRFRYRTRYFSDSGIIDTKTFVSSHYRQFKHVFISKKEKVPKPIKGLDSIYSLKRLPEPTWPASVTRKAVRVISSF